MALGQAKSLSQIYKTLSPKPLKDPEEMRAFYRDEINQARSGIPIRKRFAQALRQSFEGAFYKGLMMGSSGVGKTTELNKLAAEVEDQFSCIYFSVLENLDGINFKSTDVLLMLMILLAEKTRLPKDQGGAGQRPNPQLLQKILRWFATEKEI